MKNIFRFLAKRIGDDGTTMNGAQVFNAVLKRFNAMGVAVQHGSVGDVRDVSYRCISRKDMEWIVEQYRLQDPNYQTDKFDCDDSGDTFLADIKRGWCDCSKCPEALAFGWVFLQFEGEGGTHWMNWQIDKDGTLLLWEPQTNKIVERQIETVFCFGA